MGKRKHEKNAKVWNRLSAHMERGEMAISLLDTIYTYGLIANPSPKDAQSTTRVQQLNRDLVEFFRTDSTE